MKKELNVVIGSKAGVDTYKCHDVVSVTVDELGWFLIKRADGTGYHMEPSEVISVTLTDKESVEQNKAAELAPLSVPKEDFEIIQALRTYGLEAFEDGRMRQSAWVDAAVEQFDSKQYAAILRDRKAADENIIRKLETYQILAKCDGNSVGMLWAARCIEAFSRA